MSVVSLLGVKVLNNPAYFADPYKFEITFECLESLQKDLEWKLTYVGSATSSEHDQELDSLLVGPIPVGVNKFHFDAEPPNLSRIPASEILGVTVVLLTCSYDEREFVRVGYYVNNEYDSPELNEEPPAKPIIERVRRNVLAEKPRVTRFTIKWDSEDTAPAEFPPDQPEVDDALDDGAAYGAEEVELEEALKADLQKTEAELAAAPDADGDAAMGGVEGPDADGARDDEGEESDVGSEDLEAESSGSEDEDEAEGEGEEGGDEDMDVEEGPTGKKNAVEKAGQEVMVH